MRKVLLNHTIITLVWWATQSLNHTVSYSTTLWMILFVMLRIMVAVLVSPQMRPIYPHLLHCAALRSAVLLLVVTFARHASRLLLDRWIYGPTLYCFCRVAILGSSCLDPLCKLSDLHLVTQIPNQQVINFRNRHKFLSMLFENCSSFRISLRKNFTDFWLNSKQFVSKQKREMGWGH